MKTVPYLNQPGKNVSVIDVFGGINRSFKINENELSDSYNMSSCDYPVLSTRRPRKKLLLKNADGTKLCVEGGFSSVEVSDGYAAVLTRSGKLFYKDQVIELGVTDNRLLRTGNMFYVYPSGILVKLPSDDDGAITVEHTAKSYTFALEPDEEKKELLALLAFQPARLTATDGRMSDTIVPTDPEAGDYFVSATTGLQMYGDTGSGEYGWVSAEPDGIMVTGIIRQTESGAESIDFRDYFKVGDALFFSNMTSIDGEPIEELNSSYVVDSFGKMKNGTPAMFLNGYLNKIKTTSYCKIEKRMPAGLDFVIEHNNRLWGCFNGYDSNGNFLNEIYVSALNDPTNWFRFDGTLSQSYAMSVTSDGKFTGAAVVNGYPTFFKESCMHRIYGTTPSDFQLQTYKCAGVQRGCEKSLCEYNGTVFYKSSIGIMSITSGYPKKISDMLGSDFYTDAVAGINDGYYYICMKNPEGKNQMYVFDLNTGIWHREETVGEKTDMFFRYSNILFSVNEIIVEESQKAIDKAYNDYITETNRLVRIFRKMAWHLAIACAKRYVEIQSFPDNVNSKLPFEFIAGSDVYETEAEEDIRWSFETGDIGYTQYYSKTLHKMYVRLFADAYSQTEIEISYDSSGEWLPVATIIGYDSVKNYEVEVRPQRCDHFRLRFTGIGNVKIVDVTEFFEEGSGIG